MSADSLAKVKAEETRRRRTYFQYVTSTFLASDTGQSTPSVVPAFHAFFVRAMIGPLIVFTVAAVLMLKSSPVDWFYWHPFLMLIGTVPVATSAVLIKKIGGTDTPVGSDAHIPSELSDSVDGQGYYNTKTHGFLLFLTLTLYVGGLYVIYTNKEMHHKSHLVSWHSWIGVTAAGLLVGEACGGFFALDPDCKIRTSPTVEAYIRTFHKYGGKVTLMLAYLACITGWYKRSHWMVEGSVLGLSSLHCTIIFTIPLLVFAYVAFIKKY